jgi:hypothetical protein
MKVLEESVAGGIFPSLEYFVSAAARAPFSSVRRGKRVAADFG